MRSLNKIQFICFIGLVCSLISLAPGMAQTNEEPANLVIKLPEKAKLEVDGTVTKSEGNVRNYVSPPLTVGKKYYYMLKVTYFSMEANKSITREKKVVVEAGKKIDVDFNPEIQEEINKIKGIKKEIVPKTNTSKEEIPKTESKKGDSKKKIPNPVDPDLKKKEKTPPSKTEKKETIIVPYVPTPQNVVEDMLKSVHVKEGDVVYDLGCGDGRIVITAVKKFKAKKGVGIDLNPERLKECKANAIKEKVDKQVEFRQGDVLDIKDLSEASVVTLYLFPEVNLRLMPILKKTLKPGARIVSHDFDMGDWKPEQEIKIMDEDGNQHMIYTWTIPGKDSKEDKSKNLPKKKEK